MSSAGPTQPAPHDPAIIELALRTRALARSAQAEVDKLAATAEALYRLISPSLR